MIGSTMRFVYNNLEWVSIPETKRRSLSAFYSFRVGGSGRGYAFGRAEARGLDARGFKRARPRTQICLDSHDFFFGKIASAGISAEPLRGKRLLFFAQESDAGVFII